MLPVVVVVEIVQGCHGNVATGFAVEEEHPVVCVCVCVCERERENERETVFYVLFTLRKI